MPHTPAWKEPVAAPSVLATLRLKRIVMGHHPCHGTRTRTRTRGHISPCREGSQRMVGASSSQGRCFDSLCQRCTPRAATNLGDSVPWLRQMLTCGLHRPRTIPALGQVAGLGHEMQELNRNTDAEAHVQPFSWHSSMICTLSPCTETYSASASLELGLPSSA